MQAHLNVVALPVFPAAHLATHKGTAVVEIHLVAGIAEIHRRGKPRQSCPHDRNPHRHPISSPDSMDAASTAAGLAVSIE